MSWNDAYRAVEPYVVKIDTPAGSGTGFFFAYNDAKDLVSVATALHVVQEAHEWRQPLRIRQVDSGKQIFVEARARAILLDYERDTAVILIPTAMVTDEGLKVPENMLQLFQSTHFKRVGTELGWVGYPAIAPYTLCMFRGGVSAFNKSNDSYYLDGVAINGVSGGPVFEFASSDSAGKLIGPKIVGIVSAYHFNRHSGGNLPGLLMAHDATYLNKFVESQKDIDAAQRKAAEEAQRAAVAAADRPAAPAAGPTEPPRVPSGSVASGGGDQSSGSERQAGEREGLPVEQEAARPRPRKRRR